VERFEGVEPVSCSLEGCYSPPSKPLMLVLLDRNRTVNLGVTGSALCHLSYSSG
jgi:hypothetical protein